MTRGRGLAQSDIAVSFAGLEGEGLFTVGVVVNFGGGSEAVVSIYGTLNGRLITKASISDFFLGSEPGFVCPCPR